MRAKQEGIVVVGKSTEPVRVQEDPPNVFELGRERRKKAGVVEERLVDAGEERAECPIVLRRASIPVELPEGHRQAGDTVGPWKGRLGSDTRWERPSMRGSARRRAPGRAPRGMRHENGSFRPWRRARGERGARSCCSSPSRSGERPRVRGSTRARGRPSSRVLFAPRMRSPRRSVCLGVYRRRTPREWTDPPADAS